MTSASGSSGPKRPGPPRRVVLLGFGDFERHALASYMRLSVHRGTPFEQVASLDDADFAIADADLPTAIREVRAAGRAGDTVFIGSFAPEGALGWAMRPIDPLPVFRELEAAAVLRRTGSGESPAPREADPPTPAARGEAAPGGARRAEDSAPVPLALLVDDSDVALRFLQRQLHELGLRTEAAANSARALELLSQRRFDIVFLDIDLGPSSDLDGLALCQHLKRRSGGSAAVGQAPRVVIVSAHDAPTDRVRGAFAGCDAYLSKPLDDEALRRSLRQLGLLVGVDPAQRKRLRDGVPTSGPMPLG